MVKEFETVRVFEVSSEELENDRDRILEDQSPEEQLCLIQNVGCVAAWDQVSAPNPETAEQEWIGLPRAFFSNVNRMFALRVRGWSAVNALVNDDDMIIVREQCDVRDGDLAVVYLPSEHIALLKRFYREKEFVRLESENAEYKPLYVERNDFQVQGKVIAVVPHQCIKAGAITARVILFTRWRVAL